MQKKAEDMHKELLESISTLSDGTASDRSSSVSISLSAPRVIFYQCIRYTTGPMAHIIGHIPTLYKSVYTHCFFLSSNSISMLPAQPKIFHGCESELAAIVATLHMESPRIAILGAGGMGKTSLAKAALHHPDIVAKYQHRFFVATDSATTSIELAAIIGSHLGLKPGKDLTKPVVHYFSSSPPCLLILDNLETVWDPIESRSKVEEFLSVLTDITHLALIVSRDIYELTHINIVIGNHARCRKTCQSPMDSPISAALEAPVRCCCSANIY